MPRPALSSPFLLAWNFDLLIVVSHRDLSEIAHYLYIADDKILRDAVGRSVNIIFHSIDEMNRALKRGQYFWVDIARDGIVLYELPGHALAAPMPLTSTDAYRMAQQYFDEWCPSIDQFVIHGTDAAERGWNNKAAFELNQATERLYICYLC